MTTKTTDSGERTPGLGAGLQDSDSADTIPISPPWVLAGRPDGVGGTRPAGSSYGKDTSAFGGEVLLAAVAPLRREPQHRLRCGIPGTTALAFLGMRLS